MANVKLTQAEEIIQSLSYCDELINSVEENMWNVHLEMNRVSVIMNSFQRSWKELYFADKELRKKISAYLNGKSNIKS